MLINLVKKIVKVALIVKKIKKKMMKQTENEEGNCESKKCSNDKGCTRINGIKCMLI